MKKRLIWTMVPKKEMNIQLFCNFDIHVAYLEIAPASRSTVEEKDECMWSDVIILLLFL